MDFRIEAIAGAVLARVRAAGVDDFGNVLAPFVVDDADGAPVRCCLRMAGPGETVAAIAYRPPGGVAAYDEVGPVFIHVADCGGYQAPGEYPPGFATRRQVLRAYGRDGRIADALLVDGADEARTGIAKLLDRADVAVIQSRNVLYGCFMFAVHRPNET